MNNHYSAEQIEAYLVGGLPDGLAADLEIHLGRCDQCARATRDRYRRGGLTATLSPEAYGEAFWRDRVKRAEPSAAGGLLAAIRVTRERAGGIAADILNYLLPPQPLFPLLSTGVSPVRGDASESAKVFLGRTAGPRASVDAREDRVEVRFARIPEGDAPPRVLLVPADETSRPLEEAPQWDADEQCWSASFEPPSGEYLIAFVPNEAPEA